MVDSYRSWRPRFKFAFVYAICRNQFAQVDDDQSKLRTSKRRTSAEHSSRVSQLRLATTNVSPRIPSFLYEQSLEFFSGRKRSVRNAERSRAILFLDRAITRDRTTKK